MGVGGYVILCLLFCETTLLDHFRPQIFSKHVFSPAAVATMAALMAALQHHAIAAAATVVVSTCLFVVSFAFCRII